MIVAGIVAGGSGMRMGGEIPKQFFELGGKPVIVRTVERFLRHPQTDKIIIGINPEWKEHCEKLMKRFFPESRDIYTVDGGRNRNETVGNIISYACKSLGCTAEDIVLTHDAVRPFVTDRMINDSIDAMEYCDICTVAVPETDTVVVSSDGSTADSFPDRNTLFRVQTPQTFRMGTFAEVFEALNENEKNSATDVCRLYKDRGYRVHLIGGDVRNIKLTYPFDVKVAEFIAENDD